MTEKFNFTIEDETGRVDKYLAKQLKNVSRSKIQDLISTEHILVNGKEIKANYKLNAGDDISVTIPAPEPVDVVAQDLPLDIVYEDEDIVLINKAQGMVVHPGAGNKDGTLVNALLYHIEDLSGINGEIRPGIVHRLDKETSGLLVVAKNDTAHVHLSKQLQERRMTKKYWALVHGVIPHEHGTIEAPIGRDPKQRQQFTVINTGKEAVSHFKVLERFKDYSLVEVSIETGRTHQIRVHFKYINFPLAGDTTYGPAKTLKGAGQFLHARSLEFVHPRSGEMMTFEAPVPEIFSNTLADLRIK
jgi:23S rRNA pseudouridine1911/1915/1917 synthase